jgi:methanogenic corrinoid protein MtbC1
MTHEIDHGLVIETSARILASHVVEMHLSACPQMGERYGAESATWRSEVATRLIHLSAAVSFDEPVLFTDFVGWSKAGFSTRGVPVADLEQSLVFTREVLDHELSGPARAAAVKILDETLHSFSRFPDSIPSILEVESPHRGRLARYLEMVLEGKRAEAAHLVDEWIRQGLSVRDVYEHIIEPAQVEVGRMWHRGEITVAEEHLCTAATQIAMSHLVVGAARNSGPHTVLVTSVSGDIHSVGLRMVADFFELDGWHIRDLGASTPVADLIDAVEMFDVDILALGCKMTPHLRAARELISAVKSDPRSSHAKVIVGGAPFKVAPQLASKVGAHGTARSAPEAVAMANHLLNGRAKHA